MAFSFQDKENLYLVMDLMLGGDLRYHISRRRMFTETETSNIVLNINLRIHGGLHDYWT